MKSLKELEEIRNRTLDSVGLRKDRSSGARVVVGMGTCGIASGARGILLSFIEEARVRNITDMTVVQTGCIGACRLEPMAEVFMPGSEKVTYVNLTSEKVRRIISEHIVNGKSVDEYTIGSSVGDTAKQGGI